jgi:hypothetical protein
MEYSDVVNRTITVDNQKPAGKGFIPGFAGTFLISVIISGLFIHWRNKRN